jgi:hypothetical protein
MSTRTLTSHASQFRSSKVDCIAISVVSKDQVSKVSKFQGFGREALALKPRNLVTLKLAYPASLAIMANNGM